MINQISIDWIDGSAPNINATNMNTLQTTLEAEVEKANQFSGLTNASKETIAGYPKGEYIVTQTKLRAISSALQTKGVTPSGMWANVPSEIMQCGQGGSSSGQIGAVECILPDEGGE